MAHTAKLLQYPDLQLFDVTRYITLLRIHLQKKYPKGSRNPVELLAHGYADQGIKDLFDGDMNSIIPLMKSILGKHLREVDDVYELPVPEICGTIPPEWESN